MPMIRFCGRRSRNQLSTPQHTVDSGKACLKEVEPSQQCRYPSLVPEDEPQTEDTNGTRVDLRRCRRVISTFRPLPDRQAPCVLNPWELCQSQPEAHSLGADSLPLAEHPFDASVEPKLITAADEAAIANLRAGTWGGGEVNSHSPD